VDELMASMTTPESAAQALLGRTGLLASVRDRRRFDDCLRELFEQVGTVATDEATGSVRVRLPLPGGGSAGGDGASGPPPVLDVHYAYRDDLFALGADPAWVSAALQPRPVGERLRDGEDFSRVFAHLDPDPDRLSYVNLPKLRGMVEASGRLEAAIASDGEARRVVDLLLDPRFTGTGLGATAVDLERGCRRTSFGPTSLSGGTAVLGVIAGTAIPNLLDATDRGRQKRSLADIRSVGTAVEMYAIDNDSYPSTDGRWVPVRQIEATLAPVYIRTLPTADAWGHPLTYWSDGQRYRIASPGKDGEMSRDWSGQADPGPTSSFDSDIVFADGSFVSWPEGRQQR
jgi:general secretion pathway protein G